MKKDQISNELPLVEAKPKPKFIIKNAYNYDYETINYTANTAPSQTLPQQVDSLQKMIDNYKRGLPVDQKTPVYDSVGQMVDLRKLDLTERQALQQHLAQKLEESKKRYEQLKLEKSAADQAARLAEKEKQYQEWKARLEKEQTGK